MLLTAFCRRVTCCLLNKPKHRAWRSHQTLRIMQLTGVLLLGFALTLTARTSSQTVTFSGEKVFLEKIFDVIEKQTGHSVAFTYNLLATSKPVSVKAENMPINDFLAMVLKDLSLDFFVANKTIVIRKKVRIPSIVSGVPDEVPPIKISGTVVGLNSQPLSGATIRVKGENIIVTSDDNGYFELQTEVGNVLEISYVGFMEKEFRVRDGNPIKIELQQSSRNMDTAEVIINTGYQILPQERTTGSFSKPNKQIFDTRITKDVISKLEGITSAVLFLRNPSGSPSLQVRGESTINASRVPLIIVDNFPYDGDINNINPNDVLTVDVLKDAAAASIWGARAGNGVIVITTKKAKYRQQLRMDLVSNMTLTEKPDIFYNKNFISSAEFIKMEKNLFSQGFYDREITNTRLFPVISPVVDILAKQRDNVITPEEAESRIKSLEDNDIRNDLSKYFLGNPFAQQYSLSLSSGGDNSNIAMSLGHDKAITELVGNSNNRTTINVITTFKVHSRVELTAGVNYARSGSDARNNMGEIKSDGTQGKNIYPYANLYDEAGNPLPIVKGFNPNFTAAAQTLGLLDWQYYPIKEKNLSLATVRLDDIRLIGGTKINILDGLSFDLNYQYSKGTTTTTSFYSDSSFYVRNLVNRYTSFATDPITRNIPFGAILQSIKEEYISQNFRGQLAYNKEIKNHAISALVGAEQRELNRTADFLTPLYGYNPGNDGFTQVSLTTPYPTYPGSSSALIPSSVDIRHFTNKFRSFFGNASYGFQNTYYLTASARIDQANLFGVKANDKQVPLWSVGGKWNISNNRFYHSKFAPFLQTRITWGFSGNLLLNGSAYHTFRLITQSDGLFPGSYYQSNFTPGNAALTWEKIAQLNFGVDFSVINGILKGSLEFYKKKGTDLIGNDAIPSSTGYTQAVVNYARIKGEGIDVNLHADIKFGALKWTPGVLFSYITDKVVKYTGISMSRGAIVEGNPIASVYSYRSTGLNPENGNPVGIDSTGKTSEDYASLVLYPVNQRAYSGRLNPKYFGGFSNTINYGKFSLLLNFSYKLGYVFQRPSINYLGLINRWSGHEDYYARWQKPGDELRTTVPSFPAGLPDNNREEFYRASEALVTKGDHIRFQDILLSYHHTNEIAKGFIKAIMLSVQVSNLGIIWKANKSGIDPDYQQANYLGGKSIAASLKVSL